MLFLGCLYEKVLEKEILENSKIGLSNATNSFQWNLINGLNKNLDKPIKILNVLPVGTWPKNYKKFIISTRYWEYEGSNNIEIGCINIPFVKQINRYFNIKSYLNNINNEKEIIIYSPYLPFLKAVYDLPENYKITLIVPDLPDDDVVKRSGIIDIFRKINKHLLYKYMKRIDRFVVLTEKMVEKLNIYDKPYVVIEGLVDINTVNESFLKEEYINEKKIVTYTGSLLYKYGIGNLLDAFRRIEYEDYELWISGSGEAENEIKELCELDKRIKFKGYLTHKETIEIQRKSTLLINPRMNDGEYTKYSFPSKTIEYMVSGNPVLMYKLDGIPEQYDKYLYYVEDNTIESLKNKIVELMSKDSYELKLKGNEARKFIIENKNSEFQTKKILDMIERS